MWAEMNFTVAFSYQAGRVFRKIRNNFALFIMAISDLFEVHDYLTAFDIRKSIHLILAHRVTDLTMPLERSALNSGVSESGNGN